MRRREVVVEMAKVWVGALQVGPPKPPPQSEPERPLPPALQSCSTVPGLSSGTYTRSNDSPARKTVARNRSDDARTFRTDETQESWACKTRAGGLDESRRDALVSGTLVSQAGESMAASGENPQQKKSRRETLGRRGT